MKGSIDFSEFEKFKDNVADTKIDTSNFIKECALGLAKNYLKSVTNLTPVDTGNLKGKWCISTTKENPYYVEVILYNGADYASYVEYGHRTRNHKGWVEGKFMVTKTNEIIQAGAEKYLESKAKKFLKGLEK